MLHNIFLLVILVLTPTTTTSTCVNVSSARISPELSLTISHLKLTLRQINTHPTLVYCTNVTNFSASTQHISETQFTPFPAQLKMVDFK